MATINGQVARKMLGDAPEDKRFYCSDGRVLKNLEELASALKEMNDGTYGYHSNDTKTDFSNWIRDVIGDNKLAGDLMNGVSRVKAAKTVSDRITWLRGKTQAARRTRS